MSDFFTSLPPRRLSSSFLPIGSARFQDKNIKQSVFNLILHFLFSAISSSYSRERHFFNFIIAKVASFPGKYTTECRKLGSVLFGLPILIGGLI